MATFTGGWLCKQSFAGRAPCLCSLATRSESSSRSGKGPCGTAYEKSPWPRGRAAGSALCETGDDALVLRPGRHAEGDHTGTRQFSTSTPSPERNCSLSGDRKGGEGRCRSATPFEVALLTSKRLGCRSAKSTTEVGEDRVVTVVLEGHHTDRSIEAPKLATGERDTFFWKRRDVCAGRRPAFSKRPYQHNGGSPSAPDAEGRTKDSLSSRGDKSI